MRVRAGAVVLTECSSATKSINGVRVILCVNSASKYQYSNNFVADIATPSYFQVQERLPAALDQKIIGPDFAFLIRKIQKQFQGFFRVISKNF